MKAVECRTGFSVLVFETIKPAMETIVVSGAGSGIGRAICKKLSQEGKQLILLGRRRHLLEETARTLQGEHLIFQADVSKKADYEAIHKKLPESINITGIIANAGVGGSNEYGDRDRWDEILNANLTGTYYLINEFLPYLKRSTNPWRHIVMTSSILAKIGVPYYSAYCASKAGLLGLTKSLAVELARDQILVNAICPGWVETDMAEQGIKLLAEGMKKPYAEARAEQMSFVPLGKMAEPSEIAEVVNFLLSNRQISMTGQSIDVNGGAFMA